MALSNYTDLAAAIETWRERSGDSVIASNASTIVALVEARLNRRLRNLNRLWSVTPLTGTADDRELTLPSDFREAGFLYLTTYGEFQPLKKDTMRQLPLSSVASVPSNWAVNGAVIWLNCPCNAAHTFSLRYRAGLALESTSTNWLLSNHPDVYLHGVLAWSGILLKDEDAAIHAALVERAIAEIAAEDSVHERATLSTDPALASRDAFNINTGDFE